MENNNSLLIRKYINLMESINNKLITNEKILNEDLIASAAREGKLVASELEGYLKMMMKDNKIAQNLTKSGIRTSEELLNALKGNKLNSALKGSLELSILKSNTKNAKLIDLASENLVRNGMFDKKYAAEFAKGQPAYEKALKSAGYSDDAITKIVQKKFNQIDPKTGKPYERPQTIKKGDVDISNNKPKNADDTAKTGVKNADDAAKTGVKNADDAAKTGTQISDETVKEIDNTIKTGNETKSIYVFIKDYIKEIKVTIINNIKNYTIPKKLLYFLLISGGIAALYSLLKGNDKVIVIKDDGGNEIDPNKLPGWAQCMRNLVKSGKGELTNSSKGNPIVKVKPGTGRPEIDEKNGVLFFMDYTVLSMDGKIKGTWKCKGGKVQTIDEQSTGDIILKNDVSKMIDLLDFPVTESDLIQANKLLEKYVNNGQGKQFLDLYNDSGLADASLETSLKYIATFNPGSVQAKNQMYDKLRKIQSGKTGGGGTSTGDPLDGIEIIWGNKKKDDDKDEKPEKKDKYVDCPNFPLYFGCKGPLVSELQTCLKMTGVDGKLGPNTMATAEAWGKSNNIELKEGFPGGGGRFAVTEENFKKICGGKPVPEPITGTTTSGTTITTTGETPTTSGTTITTTGETPTNTEHPGQKLFNRLMGEKKLFPRNFLGNRRFVLKDVELTPEEQKLLEDIMFNKYRYSLIRSKEDYKDGDKLVFKSIKEKK